MVDLFAARLCLRALERPRWPWSGRGHSGDGLDEIFRDGWKGASSRVVRSPARRWFPTLVTIRRGHAVSSSPSVSTARTAWSPPCPRAAGFPTFKDQLLLSLSAANQAAVAFQNARHIHERRQAEEELRTARNELELKVARADCRAAGGQRRVERVSRRCDPRGRGRPAPGAVRRRGRGGRPCRRGPARAAWSGTSPTTPQPSAPATRRRARLSPSATARGSLEGTNVLRLVKKSGEPARIDDYSQLGGENADAVRSSGIRSTVGVPIVVAGEVWGAMVGSTREHDPLPEGTEARLADFTELVATAIQNAESREALGRLAEEQAALRRVATLVAQGVQPAEVFSAVSEEVGRLFGSNAGVSRFESEGSAMVVVGVGKNLEEDLVGTRLGARRFDAGHEGVSHRTLRPGRGDEPVVTERALCRGGTASGHRLDRGQSDRHGAPSLGCDHRCVSRSAAAARRRTTPGEVHRARRHRDRQCGQQV